MRQRQSVEVGQPPKTVFAFLEDPCNLPTWLDSVTRIDLDTPEDAIGEGTRFTHHVAEDQTPDPARFTGQITVHEPPERLAFRFDGETGKITTSFELVPTATGTRVTEAVEVPLTRWATKLLAPFLWLANRRRLKDQLEALASALEREHRQDAGRPRV